MYNLIKCSHIYLKISGSLWQCYIDEPILDGNNNIIDFSAGNNSILFKFKQTKKPILVAFGKPLKCH